MTGIPALKGPELYKKVDAYRHGLEREPFTIRRLESEVRKYLSSFPVDPSGHSALLMIQVMKRDHDALLAVIADMKGRQINRKFNFNIGTALLTFGYVDEAWSEIESSYPNLDDTVALNSFIHRCAQFGKFEWCRKALRAFQQITQSGHEAYTSANIMVNAAERLGLDEAIFCIPSMKMLRALTTDKQDERAADSTATWSIEDSGPSECLAVQEFMVQHFTADQVLDVLERHSDLMANSDTPFRELNSVVIDVRGGKQDSALLAA